MHSAWHCCSHEQLGTSHVVSQACSLLMTKGQVPFKGLPVRIGACCTSAAAAFGQTAGRLAQSSKAAPEQLTANLQQHNACQEPAAAMHQGIRLTGS